MTRKRLVILAVPCLVALAASVGFGQRGGRGGFGGSRNAGLPDGRWSNRAGVLNWENEPRFKNDVFTFVRVQYDSFRGGGRGGGDWHTDAPDSDFNFSFRLQQLTSLKVNPDPIYLRLTDPRLYDYPFLYMIEPGALYFSEEEVLALRKYLLNGGFLMVDDFWGDYQWENFHQQMKRVFPDREPTELPADHEIFRCVYHLKEKPQVPAIGSWAGPGSPTWESEYRHGGNTRDVHYRALFDDKGRMMSIICHNTDLGDGWEREGENIDYFHEFSEKKAYPMGINIIVYAMTH